MRRHRNRRVESRARHLINQTVNRWMEPLDSRVLMTGTVFATSLHDLNGNGVKDPEEPALQGWTVFVDYDRNGTLDAGEPSGTTDIDGEVFITGVPRGTWDIVEILEPGWGSSP